jgi:serine protease AprX
MNVADLGNRVVYSQNLVNNAGGSANDTYGHGTHVAGIIGGDGKDSTGSQYFYTFDGVAPNVNLVNLRVLNGTGAGQDSDVINAISQAINLKKTYNIRVINLSLGRPVEESYAQDPLCQAVESAWKAGIVVVVAAGNDGRDTTFNTNGYLTIDAPGNDPYVITVGAMNTMGTLSRADDVITSYSSKGPSPLDHIAKPDIVAPGNRITSLYGAGTYLSATYPANIDPYSLYQTGGSSSPSSEYFQLSGTSMATGVVSGAAALMLQQQPNLTPDQVKARMMISAYKAFPMYSTATDPTTGITYNEQYDVFTIGAGYLDIQTALNSSALAPNTVGAAMSPPVNYSTKNGSTTVTLVTEAPAVWSTSGAWSETNVWGTQALLNDDGVLWGNAAVWGTSSSQGFGTVWGQSVVWGKSTTDDSESSTVAIYGEN